MAVSSIADIVFTDKHKDILRDKSRLQFFEGKTGSSKSVIAGIAFFYRVYYAPKGENKFVAAAESVSAIESLIIDNDAGFMALFEDDCIHIRMGTGGNKIIIDGKYDTKTIYLVGYGNKKTYKSIIGKTLFGFLIEEIHIANEEFLREAFTRYFRDGGFMYCSGNAGLPDQMIYMDYLNGCRPHPDYEIPDYMWEELNKAEPRKGWRYWFFNFEDNPTKTQEEIDDLWNSHPVGSFEYNSKILCKRGYIEGLLYARFINNLYISEDMPIGQNILDEDLQPHTIRRLHLGIDIGDKAKTVFVLTGTTKEYQRAVVIDSYVVESKDGREVDYNEMINQFNTWFLPHYSVYRNKIKSIRPDSADSLFIKTLRNNVTIKTVNIIGSNKATIKERVAMKEQLLHSNRLLFTSKPGAQEVKKMLTKMKTDGKGGHLEEDKPWNDYNDALDYSLTPDMHSIMAVSFKNGAR